MVDDLTPDDLEEIYVVYNSKFKSKPDIFFIERMDIFFNKDLAEQELKHSNRLIRTPYWKIATYRLVEDE